MEKCNPIFDKDRAILDYPLPLDHTMLMKYTRFFAERYSFIDFDYLGVSLMMREIPIISIGNKNADKQLLYVGAHHGMEWITSMMLLRFINEFCDAYQHERRMYNVNLGYMFRTRCLHIIPMLNPDGVELQINGVGDSDPMRDRLIAMNKGSRDFSRWQANARGVDLNHNYNDYFREYKQTEAKLGITPGASKYSGEHPESEPEIASLCNYIRFNDKLGMALSLHTQGEEIYCSSRGKTLLRSKSIAKMFSRMSGYSITEPEGTAVGGGMTDWMISSENKLCFTLECGKGTNPLPHEDYFKVYAPIREILFTAPVLL